MAIGAIKSEDMNRSVFTAGNTLGVFVATVKYWFLISKQYQILDLLNRVCVFSIRSADNCKIFNDKLTGFAFVFVFFVNLTLTASLGSIAATFFGNERSFVAEMAFPLDYRNNEIAFWIAAIFFIGAVFLMIFPHFFSVIIWYLLLVCTLRYEILGNELKNMGRMDKNIGHEKDFIRRLTKTTKEKMTERQTVNEFSKDLKNSVAAHLHLRECVTVYDCYVKRSVKYFFSPDW